MSPEPEVQENYSEINNTENGGTISNCGQNLQESGELHSRKPRERRVPLENFVEPLSPASSSASQANTAATDATFEPTIDMMVNDFDDEQTLNEEEALAAMEQKDPHDEIETLKEESEMPIEMLLAKYAMRAGAEVVASAAATQKKSKKSNKKAKYKRNAESVPSNIKSIEVAGEIASSSSIIAESAVASSAEQVEENEVIVIESGDEESEAAIVSKSPEPGDIEVESEEENVAKTKAESTAAICEPPSLQYQTKEKAKSRRSHLLDLYPDQIFDTVAGRDVGNAVPLEMIYGEDDEDEEDDDEAYEEEGDNDYVKKTIMVGSSYQAVIPEGLSQYGDVLPYENEDKLIWEPSQVSEQEVEQYLLKARDMKPTLTEATVQDDDMLNKNIIGASEGSSTDNIMAAATNNDEINLQKNINDIKGGIDGDLGGVVKDNEQALHLLVQCGYDFKEALRRKRLNALPLTDTMSIWSEEECQKFEEGIQKFGKDFLKIRQNQVRTRTMRELVQFYYFWKKSDRRDHEFANADTVDHMDIYLNEGGDYGPAGATGTCHTGGPNATLATSSAARKSIQKNFSIMTGNNINSSVITTTAATASNGTHQIATNNTKVSSNRKRAVVASGSSSNGATFSTAITTNKMSGNALDTQSSNGMSTK